MEGGGSTPAAQNTIAAWVGRSKCCVKPPHLCVTTKPFPYTHLDFKQAGVEGVQQFALLH